MEDFLLLKQLHYPSQSTTCNDDLIYLSNSDFASGTYRITKAGTYKLKENIIFHPNPNNHFFPSPHNSKYPMKRGGPYILGFFAAITIESDDVIIDLNGFSISQSREFYLRQRFFNIIELGNSPFIPKQGPGNFGTKFTSVSNIEIRNGRLGLSSHNGIHGNSCNKVIIKNLDIEDFEVGGISLNDGDDIEISKVRIQNSLGTRIKVPVNGRFSSIVFLLQRYRRIPIDSQSTIQVGKKYIKLIDIRNQLEALFKTCVSECMKSSMSQEPQFSSSVFNQFGNPG